MFCICNAPYQPMGGCQRYCTTCQTWFDEDCLQPHFTFGLAAAGPKRKLYKLPVVRGTEGPTPKDWELVGSGLRMARVKKWIAKHGGFPHTYKAELDEKWVEEVLSKDWDYYRCPDCHTHC